MSISRRHFMHGALAGTAAAALTPRLLRAADESVAPAERPLSILFLGGTGFLGPATVEHAVARGHAVTLFNRGRRNPELFADLPSLRGDRDPEVGDGLSALDAAIADGARWDAVIDTSGHIPRHVRASAERLADHADYSIFVSSISAYADLATPGVTEDAPVGTMDDPTVEEFGANFENYGPLKALCEQANTDVFTTRAANVRPGLIVGPRDWSDRFTYWPLRVERGGEVLAPGGPDHPTQYIDVRDLGAFLVHLCETRAAGTFNATGPVHGTTMAEFLYGCKAVTGGDASFTWADAAFLAEHEVAPWMQMPAWVPPNGEMGGMMQASIARAVAAGLTTRPLADTVAATLAWFRSLPPERQQQTRAGLPAAREAEVLAAWHAAHSTG